MSRSPWWEIASYLYGACKHVSEFLKLPLRQCSTSRVLDFQSSSFSGALGCEEYWECQAKVPRCQKSHALWASAQVGSDAAGSSQSWQQEVVAVLEWQECPSGGSIRGFPGLGG